MGKNSVNRTKFQPSSSAKAFGQMQNTGFVGFSSGRLPGAEMSGLSGELQLAFKKAGKKDATTKMKAFNQLLDLFTSKEVKDNIDTCLNLWCNLFRGLLLERERRIRETGIRAHGILMQAAGRNVAPYLKRLIGPWILLLNDSSRSCRTLASEALQKSIPQQKHLATWVFCKEEILSYISDRLDQTQQSLCPPSIAKGTEANDIYEENMASCLLSLSFLLNTLPNSETEKLVDQYEEIFSKERLWKLTKLKASSVASAFLQLLDEALLKLPKMVTRNYGAIVPFFIQTLKAKERQTCKFLWKPLVRSFRDHSEAISSTNAKVMRQLKEQIFAFFRDGCCGVGQVAYPSLVILIPALPVSITGENKEKYFEQLLLAVWKGTETKAMSTEDMADLISCYVDVLLFVLNEFFLVPSGSEDHSAYSRFLTKPFQEFFQTKIPNSAAICSQFVRLFTEIEKKHPESVSTLFKLCVECMEQVFDESLDSNESKENLRRIAAFLGTSYVNIQRLVTSGKPNVIQHLFSKAMEQENLGSLLFASTLTDSIPFESCIPSEQRKDYYNASLLPMAKRIIHTNAAHSEEASLTFDLLGNYFPDDQTDVQGELWNDLLLLFQELNELEGLYAFLRKHVHPGCDASIWRNPILDEIVKTSCTESVECPVDTQFKFLTFALGGNTMTTDASVVSKATRIAVIEQISKELSKYHQESVSEENFNMGRIQYIVSGIKLACDCLATNIMPTASEEAKKVRLQVLRTFFELSVDIKYFWKKISLDLSSFTCSASDAQFDHFDLSSTGFTEEQIQQSPVALAARYAWDMNQSTLQDHIEKEERIAFIRTLVESVHHEMQHCDITWFRPALHTKQIRMLLSVAEHSASQFVLDLAIQSEESWIASRESINNLDSLVDFFKGEISFFCAPQGETKHENVSGATGSYARMLCFLVCLMKEVGIHEVVGKADFRRIWTIYEAYCGYVLCKDILLPPVEKSTESDEEWAMVVETLLPMMNEQFSFPPALVSPFNKALIQCMFSRISGEHASVIDSYAGSFLLRKIVNGDHLRSADFLSTFLPSLTSDILTKTGNNSDLMYFQCLLPELFGNLKANQCDSLEVSKVYQTTLEHAMNQKISPLALEVLVDLSGQEGIICDADRASVASSLVVFFSEWEKQELDVLRDPCVRVQCLRLFVRYCSHDKMREQVREHSNFFVSFIVNSVAPKDLSWDSQTSCSLLYNALKLSKLICKDFRSENNSLENLFSWLVGILTATCNVIHYTPSLYNLFHTLAQTIQGIPKATKLKISAEQKARCYKLLRAGHYGLQKASFHVLMCSIASEDSINIPEETEQIELRDLLPAELFDLIHKGNQVESIFLSADWLCHETLESEDIGYFYRSGLIEFVSYSFAWLLLAELYSRQSLDIRRPLSSCLRSEATVLLGFIFRYVELRSPSCIPDELDLRGFDPCYVESLDRFLADLYLIVLRVFPSLVREWWCTDCNRALNNSVESYTTRYVSPSLIRHELRIVQEFEHDYDNFEVKGNTQMKQIMAFYEEDEVQLGISLTIPDSYPLRDIIVSSEKKIGVTETQWRQWMLSIHVLLHTQDANVLDAVLLWKSRMDKLFEGIECCLICYSVFQASNNALPRLACKTCKNKFHSACLYKWFNTSHKSNCPLCQTPWME